MLSARSNRRVVIGGGSRRHELFRRKLLKNFHPFYGKQLGLMKLRNLLVSVGKSPISGNLFKRIFINGFFSVVGDSSARQTETEQVKVGESGLSLCPSPAGYRQGMPPIKGSKWIFNSISARNCIETTCHH
jgi:hypothetical protein